MIKTKKDERNMAIPKQKKHAYDIFALLKAIDTKNMSYFSSLDEDTQKAIPMLVVMRWLSVVPDSTGLSEYYALMTNEIVNDGFWELSKHPKLQYLLMCMVGCGKSVRHKWIPMSNKKTKNDKIDALLRLKYPNVNDTELNILWKINTTEDIKQLAYDYGYDDKQIKEFGDIFDANK